MADFDEKLNSLLSNPEAMSQIMKLAQSLSDGDASAPPPAASASSAASPSLEQLLQGLQNAQKPAASPTTAPSGLGLDPQLIARLLPLVQELGGQQDSNARQLLYALRPYLKEERQSKVERALQLARLFRVGKKFLAGWEGW